MFNDANINLFQNASSGAIEDLNVATADLKGWHDSPSQLESRSRDRSQDVGLKLRSIPQPEVQIFETSFGSEEPLFVQTVQEKFYIVVYFRQPV